MSQSYIIFLLFLLPIAPLSNSFFIMDGLWNFINVKRELLASMVLAAQLPELLQLLYVSFVGTTRQPTFLSLRTQIQP
ncbi:MAG: hypothetical protein KF860_14795 [Cyclobacteriaceae bacterium]|nr:hypothetical protein [Cyclobacteriaceae bacterium]